MAFIAALAIGALVGAAGEKQIRALARSGVKLAVRAQHDLKRMTAEIKEDLEDISEEVDSEDAVRAAAQAVKDSGRAGGAARGSDDKVEHGLHKVAPGAKDSPAPGV